MYCKLFPSLTSFTSDLDMNEQRNGCSSCDRDQMMGREKNAQYLLRTSAVHNAVILDWDFLRDEACVSGMAMQCSMHDNMLWEPKMSCAGIQCQLVSSL